MSGPAPDNRPSETAVTLRRFLTRGEAATLLGMLLTVMSLFLVWKRMGAQEILQTPVPAVFAEKEFFHSTRHGNTVGKLRCKMQIMELPIFVLG